MGKADTYQIITDLIIEKLESIDTSDYKKPWFDMGYSPINAISGKAYKGINNLLLSGNNYNSNYYASFKQWQEKGCKVKKGERSHIVTLWKFFKDEKTDKEFPMIRYFRVFNSEQVEGDFAREIEEKGLRELENHDPIIEAEQLINGFLKSEFLECKLSDRACYSHSLTGNEHIAMPSQGQFPDLECYYSVFFHEMTHATGNAKRLDRDLSGKFGSKEYAKEELVAELGAAFLCGSIGLSERPRLDHAQYISTWLSVLRNDKRFIVSAASQAQKAADYIQEKADGYNAWKNTKNEAAG